MSYGKLKKACSGELFLWPNLAQGKTKWGGGDANPYAKWGSLKPVELFHSVT